MSLPVLIQHIARTRLGAFCERRVPAAVRDQVRLELEFADNQVTLVESRPYFRDPSQWTRLPVARFRFNAAAGTWSLDCPRLREKNGWSAYPVAPSRELEKLIRIVDQDESGVFWG
jgi:Protein of unknown function (DUF3024)